MRLSGMTVYVRDWPAAVKWYSEVLGLTIGPYESDDQFCMMFAGDGFIALASDHPEYAGSTDENRVAPSLEVDDLDETLRLLASRGVRVDEVEGEAEGYRLSRVWDPEGNRINLFAS